MKIKITQVNTFDNRSIEVDTDMVEEGQVLCDSMGWEWKVEAVQK